jgi:hypothetical protein
MADWTDSSSAEEIEDHLRSNAEAMNALCEQVQRTLRRNERNFILHQLLAQTGVHIQRMADWLSLPMIDPLAWAARNLFELNLLVRWILLSDENIRHFMGQRVRDEIDILEGVLELAPDQPNDEPRRNGERVMTARIKELQNVSARHSVQPEKPLNIDRMADAVGLIREYRAFHKLCSKYVHPSSWLVTGHPEDLHALERRNIFLLEGQRAALDTLHRVRQLVEDEGDDSS